MICALINFFYPVQCKITSRTCGIHPLLGLYVMMLNQDHVCRKGICVHMQED